MRVPAMQPLARASLSGLSMATSRAQVARAVLEGIAQSVAACLEADEAVAEVAVNELIVGGGLSGSDDLLQMQADLAGVPIRRKRNTARASLRGAAFLAGSSGLLWDGIPVLKPTEDGDEVFVPRLDRQAREARRALWSARVGAELNHADLCGQMEPSPT
jgi:glycerol kinase